MAFPRHRGVTTGTGTFSSCLHFTSSFAPISGELRPQCSSHVDPPWQQNLPELFYGVKYQQARRWSPGLLFAESPLRCKRGQTGRLPGFVTGVKFLPGESGTARCNLCFVRACARLNWAGKSGLNWGSTSVTKRVLPRFLRAS